MTKKVNLSTTAGADVSTINEAVSQRIKQFRSQKKMSLDELARRSGVSKGMLVEIEGCKANPSIALLCKIAAAMGVSVADVVNVASGPDMLELWQWIMHPGEQFESAGHPADTCELLFVNQGTLTLTVDGRRFIIREGCSAVARTDMPHAYVNDTNEVLEFTMTVNEKSR